MLLPILIMGSVVSHQTTAEIQKIPIIIIIIIIIVKIMIVIIITITMDQMKIKGVKAFNF